MKSFCNVPSVIFMTPGSRRHMIACSRSTCAISCPIANWRRIVFVLADQVEEASADVNIAAGYRERIYDVGIENEKLVIDFFAVKRLE